MPEGGRMRIGKKGHGKDGGESEERLGGGGGRGGRCLFVGWLLNLLNVPATG